MHAQSRGDDGPPKRQRPTSAPRQRGRPAGSESPRLSFRRVPPQKHTDRLSSCRRTHGAARMLGHWRALPRDPATTPPAADSPRAGSPTRRLRSCHRAPRRDRRAHRKRTCSRQARLLRRASRCRFRRNCRPPASRCSPPRSRPTRNRSRYRPCRRWRHLDKSKLRRSSRLDDCRKSLPTGFGRRGGLSRLALRREGYLGERSS